MNRQERFRQILRGGLISLAVMIAAAVVLAALGPFGSFASGDFATRLAYWVPAALIGYVVFRPIIYLGDLAAEALDLPRAATIAAAILVAALPGTLAIAALNGHLSGGLPPLDRLTSLYLNVAIVGSLITLTFLALERGAPERGRRPPSAAPASEASTPRAAFLDRLPQGFTSELIALEMEDHYVRAHGADGRSSLLLMRMADAERELAGCEGLRVHRSWWVARDAVEGKRRDGRRLWLRLRGGIEAPVARDRASALREAGWI